MIKCKLFLKVKIIIILLAMFPQSGGSAVPPNKYIQQLITQAIQSFYLEDYESGVHFLEEIRRALPRMMYQLNPILRSLCKEIIKIVQGGLVKQRESTTKLPSEMPIRDKNFIVSDSDTTSTDKTSTKSAMPTHEKTNQDTVTREDTFPDKPTKSIIDRPSAPLKDPFSDNTPQKPKRESSSSPMSDFSLPDTDTDTDTQITAAERELISEISSVVKKKKDKKLDEIEDSLTGTLSDLQEYDD